MIAPGGWRGRRAPRRSARGPRTPPPRHPACAPPARRTAQAASPGASSSRRCRSSPRRIVSRSAASRIARLPSGRRGVGDRGRQQPHQPLRRAPRWWTRRTGRLRIPARPRCRPARRRWPRCSTSATDRSNFALGGCICLRCSQQHPFFNHILTASQHPLALTLTTPSIPISTIHSHSTILFQSSAPQPPIQTITQ